MTIKHTPGPWQVKPAAGGNLFICSSSRKPSIAGVALTAIGIDREESEANAKLIAAAPDLLNALQGVMDWWMNDTDGAEEMARELFDAALLALEKAKEETEMNDFIELKSAPCPFCGGGDIEFTAIEGAGPNRDYGAALMCRCGGAMISNLEDSSSSWEEVARRWESRSKAAAYQVAMHSELITALEDLLREAPEPVRILDSYGCALARAQVVIDKVKGET